MGLLCHSDLLCEFILQEFYRKFGVIFKFVSYAFAIKMYNLFMIDLSVALCRCAQASCCRAPSVCACSWRERERACTSSWEREACSVWDSFSCDLSSEISPGEFGGFFILSTFRILLYVFKYCFEKVDLSSEISPEK